MRFDHPDLFACLNPVAAGGTPQPSGTQIVTPTPLLAAALQRQYANEQIAAGFAFWPQPPILSLSAWLQQLWRDARISSPGRLPLLLSNDVERFLWRQAIRESDVEVLDLTSTAVAAVSAARFASDWEVPFDNPAWESTEDTSRFRQWHSSVQSRCRDESWVLPSQLLPHVTRHLDRFSLPAHLVFAGFSEMTAALRSFRRALPSSLVRVSEALPTAHPPSLAALPCADSEAEFEAAARWARARAEESPNRSIAIFVQNLEAQQALVFRMLRDVLEPSAILRPLDTPSQQAVAPFRIHSGSPNRDQPIIAAALAIIDLSRSLVPVPSISAFLSTPYLPISSEERAARARVDAQLRRKRELELPFTLIQSSAASVPQLAAILARMQRVNLTMPQGSTEPAVWSRFWRQLLQASGWPAIDPSSQSGPLSDTESDAVDEWSTTFTSFDSLGVTGVRFNAAEAVKHLHTMLSAPARAKTDLSAPIQVLDPAHARPLRFDAAWLTAASEVEWPPVSFPPAYLPQSLVRAAGAPSATTEGRQSQARSFSSYIEASAPAVIGSYSGADAGGARLSAFFQPLQQFALEDLHVWQGETLLEKIQLATLEGWDDTNAPPLPSGIAVAGGSSLLKSQSECPFRAFIRGRLRSETLEDGDFAYDARQRGDFLHNALAAVWSEIRDSQKLRSLPEEALGEIVARGVAKALAVDLADTDFRTQLRASEAARIKAIILRWLEVEKQRPGNFRVLEAETPRECSISQLSLRLRADRIDQLDDGSLVVIDYKSGKIKRAFLDNDRPREPQLLAYATMLQNQPDTRVDGIYFATLRGDACDAEGYGRVGHFKKTSVPADWKLFLKERARVIHNLAKEFENGVALRAETDTPCTYCEVKPICRIEESRKRAGAEDAE